MKFGFSWLLKGIIFVLGNLLFSDNRGGFFQESIKKFFFEREKLIFWVSLRNFLGGDFFREVGSGDWFFQMEAKLYFHLKNYFI